MFLILCQKGYHNEAEWGSIEDRYSQDNLLEMMLTDTFDLMYAISCLSREMMAQVGFSLVTNSEQK